MYLIHDPGRSRTAPIYRITTVLIALAAAWLFARYALATTLKNYDDEGYLLLSVYHYLKEGSLYQAVFSQYGPFYFYAQEALFGLLRAPVNHDGGRLVTLVWWLLTAGAAGYFVYQVSRNAVLAAAAILACTKLVSFLANEPGHPQQVIFAVMMWGCCAAAVPKYRRLGLVLWGALGTALVFTKINAGIFYLAALAHTLLCTFPAGRIKTAAVALSLAFAALFPVVLMHRDINGWARGYCVSAALCGVCTFLAGAIVMPAAAQPVRDALDAAAGAVGTGLLIVGSTMSQGMSIGTLLDGVVWAPLRHPQVFALPLVIGNRKLLAIVLLCGCVAVLYRLRERYEIWVNALRCVIGLSALLAVFSPRDMVWILPVLPVGLIPAGRPWSWQDAVPRVFVASLAAMQFLQAYPVSPDHVEFAGAAAILWALLCIHDGVNGIFLATKEPARLPGDSLAWASATGGLVALILIAVMFRPGSWSMRYVYPPSHLQGTESVHIPPEIEARYLFLAQNIKANCDFLFTLPGMGSLNFWSGVPTPNGSNMTQWMKGFTLDRQQKILDVLAANPRGCAVYHAELVKFWESTPEELDALPLAHYVIHNMRKVAEKDGYEIRVHPMRTAPWSMAGYFSVDNSQQTAVNR